MYICEYCGLKFSLQLNSNLKTMKQRRKIHKSWRRKTRTPTINQSLLFTIHAQLTVNKKPREKKCRFLFFSNLNVLCIVIRIKTVWNIFQFWSKKKTRNYILFPAFTPNAHMHFKNALLFDWKKYRNFPKNQTINRIHGTIKSTILIYNEWSCWWFYEAILWKIQQQKNWIFLMTIKCIASMQPEHFIFARMKQKKHTPYTICSR